MTRTTFGVALLVLANAVTLACDAAPDALVRQVSVVDTTRTGGGTGGDTTITAVNPPPPPPNTPFIVDTGATPGGRLVFPLGADLEQGPVQIYSMLTDGTGLTPVTPSDEYAWSPTWSPDDSLIAYTSYNGRPSVSVVRPDGSGRRQLVDGEFPFWLADGRIGYSCASGLCVVDASGANAAVLLSRPTGNLDQGYTLSPDGTLIAFNRLVRTESQVYYGAMPSNIYVMRRDGTGERRLTSTDSASTYEYFPTWSRDGSQIAFASWSLGVVVADADGGRLHSVSQKSLLQGLAVGAPVWSPDGTKVLFGGGTFYIANADGSGAVRRVTAPMPGGMAPCCSWSWSTR